ncbi:hypothetical protein MOE90_20250 [Bacillus spizizenii]|nr:hypothetical protein [Bacillus spizizenii]MCY9124973.1 hypothetical protein [Bacillus spizizenii]
MEKIKDLIDIEKSDKNFYRCLSLFTADDQLWLTTVEVSGGVHSVTSFDLDERDLLKIKDAIDKHLQRLSHQSK